MQQENNQTQSNERRNAAWDIKNAPRNYLSLVLTQFGSAFFSFATVWLISQKIGSEGYGGVVAIIAASQVAQILVNWTSYAVVRFGTEEFVETEKIARAFWLRFLVLVPNLALVVLASKFWFPPLAGWLKLSADSFWLVILHFASAAFWIHVQFSLQSVKLPRVQGFLLMIERVLILAGIGILVALENLNPLTALLCYPLAALVAIVAGTIYLRKYIFARFSVDLKFIKEIVAYSLPLLPFSLVGYFSGSYVDAIFVSKFLSTKDLGIYSIATQINGIALQFPTLANSLLLPFFVTLQTGKQFETIQRYFKNVVPTLSLFWGLGCVILATFFEFVLPLVFGEEFRGSESALWILLSASAVSAPVLFGYTAFSHAVSATYISTVAAVLAATVNILLNFLLIPKYGLVGCAWATFFSYLISALSVIILTRRIGNFSLSWLFYAILPVTVSVIVFSVTKSSLISLAIALAVAAAAALIFRNSFSQTIATLKSLRNR